MWDSSRDSSGITGGFTSKNIAGSSRESAVRVRNIVPVMIGLLHRAKGELKVLGKPVHIVSILGILQRVKESATKETYVIGDETGTITAFRRLEAENSTSSPSFKLDTEQSLVLSVIKAEDKTDDTGIHRSVLIQKVPQYIVSRLDAILDFLSGEGHIYTTLNNEYFKAT
ncbi:uncharacterized protein LOC144473319 [Augochlora pura]